VDDYGVYLVLIPWNALIMFIYANQVGKKGILKLTVRNKSLYEISDDNGVRVLNFATTRNVIVKRVQYVHIATFVVNTEALLESPKEAGLEVVFTKNTKYMLMPHCENAEQN
jgi:hypothetical protein